MYICRNARWTVWLLRLWTLQLAELSLVLLSKWTQGREEPGRWWTKLHGTNFAWNRPLTVHVWGGAVSQKQTYLRKKGKGRIPVQAMSCCTVLCKSNYITVSCHVAHYITFCSRNSGLENGDRELGHLFCYYRNCKNNSTVAIYRFSESVHTLQQVRFHVCIIWNLVTSSNWLHSSGLYTQFTSLYCGSGSGLRD